MDSRNFWGYGAGFQSLPRCCFPQRRAPAYPFFRKEKMHPCMRGRGCDAERFERVLQRAALVPRTESPLQRVFRRAVVGEEFPRLGLRRNPCAAQGVSRTRRGAFFFTKKAFCVNQSACVAGRRKSVQTNPHPFFALKIMGFQRDLSLWKEARRVKACGFDPWAEPSRSCPSEHAEVK